MARKCVQKSFEGFVSGSGFLSAIPSPNNWIFSRNLGPFNGLFVWRFSSQTIPVATFGMSMQLQRDEFGVWAGLIQDPEDNGEECETTRTFQPFFLSQNETKISRVTCTETQQKRRVFKNTFGVFRWKGSYAHSFKKIQTTSGMETGGVILDESKYRLQNDLFKRYHDALAMDFGVTIAPVVKSPLWEINEKADKINIGDTLN